MRLRACRRGERVGGRDGRKLRVGERDAAAHLDGDMERDDMACRGRGKWLQRSTPRRM